MNLNQYKTSYKDFYILALMILTMGGVITYALFKVYNLFIPLGIVLLYLFCTYWMWDIESSHNKKVNNRSLYLFKRTPAVATPEQTKYLYTVMDEELNGKRKVFYDVKKAKKFYWYVTDKAHSLKEFDVMECKDLNLYLLGFYDMHQMYERWRERIK